MGQVNGITVSNTTLSFLVGEIAKNRSNANSTPPSISQVTTSQFIECSVVYVSSLAFVSVPPAAPLDCHLINLTSHSIVAKCRPGFDGGLPQHFQYEIYDLQGQSLANSPSPPSTISTIIGNPEANQIGRASLGHENLKFRPEFQIDRIPPDTDFQLLIFAANAKGRSEPFPLRGRTRQASLLEQQQKQLQQQQRGSQRDSSPSSSSSNVRDQSDNAIKFSFSAGKPTLVEHNGTLEAFRVSIWVYFTDRKLNCVPAELAFPLGINLIVPTKKMVLQSLYCQSKGAKDSFCTFCFPKPRIESFFVGTLGMNPLFPLVSAKRKDIQAVLILITQTWTWCDSRRALRRLETKVNGFQEHG